MMDQQWESYSLCIKDEGGYEVRILEYGFGRLEDEEVGDFP